MCDGFMGGAGGDCYANLGNVVGMGDVVVPGNGHLGSGDKFDNVFGAPAQKRSMPKKQHPATPRQKPQNNRFHTSSGSSSASQMMQPRPLYVPIKK